MMCVGEEVCSYLAWPVPQFAHLLLVPCELPVELLDLHLY